MLDELHLHRMIVKHDECMSKAPQDLVFIINADLTMVWKLSMDKISVEKLLCLCSKKGSSRSRVFFLLDERAPKIDVASLLQRVFESVGDEVYIVGLCEGEILEKISFSMICPKGMSCHACRLACVKWRGFPLDVEKAKRLISYLPVGTREVVLN